VRWFSNNVGVSHVVQTGDIASVTVDFPDFSLNIVEFVLVDKNRNHW